MTDPSQTRQPTQEELEAHLAQLRDADPAEVVVQAVNMLATGAQVKLGRSDARVLIDGMSALADACDGRIAAQLVQQIRDAVGQLQMAQVQAEREGGAEAGEGAQQPGAGEAASPAAGEAGGQGAPQGQQGPLEGQQPGAPGQPAGKRMTDRLWIPGREPGAQ